MSEIHSPKSEVHFVHGLRTSGWGNESPIFIIFWTYEWVLEMEYSADSNANLFIFIVTKMAFQNFVKSFYFDCEMAPNS